MNWLRKNSNGKKKGRLQSQDGLAAMEFALILPLVSVMLFGIIDFGRLLYAREVMANASREGARQGIRLVTPPLADSDIETITKDKLRDGHLDSSKATVNVTGTGGGFGTDLTVNLQYQFDFLVVSKLVPGMSDQMTLQSTTVMSNE